MKTLAIALGTIAALGSIAGWSILLTVASIAAGLVTILVLDISNDHGWSK
tara:strand:+ start:390 stop:539 length:150 start_codon:yes stop_codon:yes gene_type:complete